MQLLHQAFAASTTGFGAVTKWSISSKETSSSHRDLVQIYQRLGGVRTGDEVAYLMSETVEQAISVVAKWVVAQRVVYLQFEGQLLLPMFQFEPEFLTPRPSVVAAIDELMVEMSSDQIASWFVSPEPSLGGCRPIDALDADPVAVRCAARLAVQHD